MQAAFIRPLIPLARQVVDSVLDGDGKASVRNQFRKLSDEVSGYSWRAPTSIVSESVMRSRDPGLWLRTLDTHRGRVEEMLGQPPAIEAVWSEVEGISESDREAVTEAITDILRDHSRASADLAAEWEAVTGAEADPRLVSELAPLATGLLGYLSQVQEDLSDLRAMGDMVRVSDLAAVHTALCERYADVALGSALVRRTAETLGRDDS